MTASTTPQRLFVDLLSREGDGVEVTLLWNVRAESLSVFVWDCTTTSTFEIAVEPSEALDAFEHPFVYRERSRTVDRADGSGAVTPR